MYKHNVEPSDHFMWLIITLRVFKITSEYKSEQYHNYITPDKYRCWDRKQIQLSSVCKSNSRL